jgi:hypothetical protein
MQIADSVSCCRGEHSEYVNLLGGLGTAVAQLVEALRYKLAGHRFDSQWCQWIFSLT